MRVFLARSATEWDTWLADSAKATPWDALAASAKGDYYTLYGANAKRPVGRAVVNLAPFPKNAWLLRYSADLQTMIILR